MSSQSKTGQEPVRPRLLSYQTAVLQDIGRREDQQDAFVIVNARDLVAVKNKGLLAIVADGMGGMSGGSQASAAVTDRLVHVFEQLDRDNDLSIQLREGVESADDAVFRLLGGYGGSTVISCLIYQEKLWFACVGDSGLYLLRNGQLSRLNRPQNSFTLDCMTAVQSGSMDREAYMSGNNKAALTHFVGMGEVDDIDHNYRPLRLMDGDVLLLCSDGVDGVVSKERITECLSTGSAREMCSRLGDSVVKANNPHQDNYTAVVVRCLY